MSAIPLEHRLATYGTLAPGEPNHHHLAHLAGAWSTGAVRGHLSDDGWGADRGAVYPAFTPDPDGPEVAVQVLESAELPAHWDHLDDFEGEGYVRIPITVHRADDQFSAYIYRRSADRSERWPPGGSSDAVIACAPVAPVRPGQA